MDIDVERRVAHALELHERGFNCAQCVACATCDLAGLDEKTAFRLAEGFGGGMGGFTETCGAISGGIMVMGYRMSKGPDGPITKKSTYVRAKQLVEDFQKKNGSTLCGVLRGETGGPKLRTCDGCIEDGVRLALAQMADIDATA